MKRIAPLPVDDVAILTQLAQRPALSSYPLLAAFQYDVEAAYAAYALAGWAIPGLHPILPVGLQDSMRKHYDNQVRSLEFIDQIRHQLSAGVCPTCGSQAASTADHVLPKAAWPVYSFFSKNLVPACDQCNRKKSDKFFAEVDGARPIHPYYDDFLLGRVVVAKLSPPYASPLVEIVGVQGLPLEISAVVEWHLAEVVRKTSIAATLLERWLNICRAPEMSYASLAYGATMEDAVRGELQASDVRHQTPNNWESMLQAGILDDQGAIEYLMVCRVAPQPNPG